MYVFIKLVRSDSWDHWRIGNNWEGTLSVTTYIYIYTHLHIYIYIYILV